MSYRIRHNGSKPAALRNLTGADHDDVCPASINLIVRTIFVTNCCQADSRIMQPTSYTKSWITDVFIIDPLLHVSAILPSSGLPFKFIILRRICSVPGLQQLPP